MGTFPRNVYVINIETLSIVKHNNQNGKAINVAKEWKMHQKLWIRKKEKQKQIVNSTTNSGLDVLDTPCAMREVLQIKLFPSMK